MGREVALPRGDRARPATRVQRHSRRSRTATHREPQERFPVHRTVFPRDFLEDFGFVTVRHPGRVEAVPARARGSRAESRKAAGPRSRCAPAEGSSLRRAGAAVGGGLAAGRGSGVLKFPPRRTTPDDHQWSRQESVSSKHTERVIVAHRLPGRGGTRNSGFSRPCRHERRIPSAARSARSRASWPTRTTSALARASEIPEGRVGDIRPVLARTEAG